MSKTASLIAIISAAVLAVPVTAGAQALIFREEPLAALPKDFDQSVVGVGGRGRWEVVSDDTAIGRKALAQLSTDASEHRFLMALYMPVIAADVAVTARFKLVDGKTDQAGGVAVRIVDANNYYVARANALENNVRLYRVKGEVREQLATADVKVASGVWHTLTLRAQGNQITVLFDNQLMHSTKDTTPFPNLAAGRAGVWTKSDSITYFDWIDINPFP